MNNPKHTPGPWAVSDDGDITLIIHAPKGEVDIACMSNDCEMFSEIRSNAHLIAAAPDMLEALHVIKSQSIGDDWTAEAAAPAMYAETRAAFELLIDLRDLSVMPSAYQAIIQKHITALQTALAQQALQFIKQRAQAAIAKAEGHAQ